MEDTDEQSSDRLADAPLPASLLSAQASPTLLRPHWPQLTFLDVLTSHLRASARALPLAWAVVASSGKLLCPLQASG